MVLDQRFVQIWIGVLLALASAPAGAAPPPDSTARSEAGWGYHPPPEERAVSSQGFCSLDLPYTEPPFLADQTTGIACPGYATQSPLCTGPFCPESRVCPGTSTLHEDLNTCDGAGCCLPGSVDPDGVVDVLPYLARPAEWPFSADASVDRSTNVDDSPGIATAIECAASLSASRRTVAFAAGRYVLRTPLRPHHDALTLEGPELSPEAPPGDPNTATLVAIPCNPEQYPGAIQVTRVVKPDGTIISAVQGLWIRNLQIAITEGPRTKANSGIQLNTCSDCKVENVILRYSPLVPQLPSCKPSNLEGIGFTWGSGGVIRNVLVDGFSKSGIYLSSIAGYHDTPPILVENCEIRNIDGPVSASGIKIVTANVTVRNCHVHHNMIHPGDGSTTVSGGHGIWISTQISPGPGIPSPVPYNVVVKDSYFHHNGGSGVVLASPLENERPKGILIKRVKFAYNGGHGVHVQAGAGVEFLDVWSWGNALYGVLVSSRTTLPATSTRVEDVTLENLLVFDNALRFTSGSYPGIRIEASDVTIHGGAVARCEPWRGTQSRSIQQQCWLSGPAGAQVLSHPEENVISDVRTDGLSAPEVLACPY